MNSLQSFTQQKRNGINVSLPSTGTSLDQTESDLGKREAVTCPWSPKFERGRRVGMEIIHTSSREDNQMLIISGMINFASRLLRTCVSLPLGAT